MACPHSSSDEPCAVCRPPVSGLVEPDQATFISEAKPAAAKADGLDFGTRVDRYVVHDLIGRGGMGLVYTAHDPDLDRWVAIKLLRGSAAPGDAASLGQARLLREAQAMAQLSHPNVMPVYDVGKYEQSVFVAMELVRGVTLDKWVNAGRAGVPAERLRELPSGPRPKSVPPRPWREVLGMFLQAGRGLEAAHAAGLVHRDFKPANVLIGEDGRPRVTDFGIARSVRAVEKAASGPTPLPATPVATPSSSSSNLDQPLTRAGSLMGSPGYMAPEQYAGLPTSPATDQFSFCIALYEALYGTRPFHGKTLAELAHATTLGHVPAAPRGSSVPPWVHRVIEQGLEPDPQRRHASMTALLQALSHDPDQQRRRVLAWAGGAVALLGCVAAVVGTQVQAQRACRGADALLLGVWDDAARAKGKQAFEATGKSYAALAWDQARAQMDAYARAWVAARTEACAATRVRGEQSEAVMEARLECLDQRRAELSALAQAYGAADVETVDRAYGAAGRLSDLDACANARPGHRPPPPESKEAWEQYGRELAQGRSLTSAGKFDAAREHLTSALQISRALKMAAEQGEAELSLGDLERETRRLAKANEAYLRAVRWAEAAGDDETATRALSALVSLVGWRLERPEEGLAFALVARGKLERLGSEPRLEAALDEAVGDAQWQTGDRVASMASYRKALAGFTALEGGEGLDVARLHSSIGWVMMEQGQLAEARVELSKSQQLRAKLLGPEHPTQVSSWNELGELAIGLGDSAEAVRCFERALLLNRAAIGNDSTSTARLAMNLVNGLVEDGRAEEGVPLVEHAAEVLDRHPDAPASTKVQLERSRGIIAAALRRWEEAEVHARRALALSETANGPRHPVTGIGANDLARVLTARGQWAEALVMYDRFLAIEEQLAARADPEYAVALAESARPLIALKREKEGFERLDRAIAMVPLEKGDHRRAAKVRLVLAEVLWPTDKERARKVALEARAELELGKRTRELAELDGWLSKGGGG